ncbi:MAG TPA: hypothetical protein VMG38_19290 [Trebonia sp.]|nr:hypothetical protein [Trebonia sp.]
MPDLATCRSPSLPTRTIVVEPCRRDASRRWSPSRTSRRSPNAAPASAAVVAGRAPVRFALLMYRWPSSAIIASIPASHGIDAKNSMPPEMAGDSQPGPQGRTGASRLTSSDSPSQRAMGSTPSPRSRYGATTSMSVTLRPAGWSAGRPFAALTAAALVPVIV